MKRKSFILLCLVSLSLGTKAESDFSIAREWNEIVLTGIRNDYARPTVHARNLFHTSAAMYDLWTVFNEGADPYFLNNTHRDYYFEFDKENFNSTLSKEEGLSEAISYAVYRIIEYRFKYSPDTEDTMLAADKLMEDLGHDITFTNKDYTSGSPAALGNYLANQIIEYGFNDGSNELLDFANTTYQPVNNAMVVFEPGDQGLLDPNRWQPLAFENFIDQSGNEIGNLTPDFLSPEWGDVEPFSFTSHNLSSNALADGYVHDVYVDPGEPAYFYEGDNEKSSIYKWAFSLVSVWSSHLDATHPTTMDISPNGIGGLDLDDFPKSHAELSDFYNEMDGGDPGTGYDVNPYTGKPYAEQVVPRGDYARVLAEFWADGPASETPPGHWFTILNYVSDNPALVKKFNGKGRVLSDLEWDIFSYFTLAGAMHDSAISAWSVKGYYDYIRPISVIRYLSGKGQSSDETKANYHVDGIELKEGLIETVEIGDPLAGDANENVGKIKLYAWRGHAYIPDPLVDVAGVDWILAENWMPYQRASFVTPPFAGYVSGHSTFSRAAAYILSEFTGDEYFPGGMGIFDAFKNDFLVFEEGPSMDIELQWAKYYDAADQCSLSRIWGGIHPPTDDINGRVMGQVIGEMTFEKAKSYFQNAVLSSDEINLVEQLKFYPNPVMVGSEIVVKFPKGNISSVRLLDIDGRLIQNFDINKIRQNRIMIKSDLSEGIYLFEVQINDYKIVSKLIVQN